MDKSLRTPVIAGNWKMNLTPAAAKALIEEVKPLVADAGCGVVFCVPYVDIAAAAEAAAGSNIKIGAQNVHWESKGAYTGEISAEMLQAVGAEYAVIGHSERRQFFGETDVTVNLRVKAALAAGLKVILCNGELLEQRQQGITMEVVRYQTKINLAGVSASALANVIIAYEPVWAIGTGLTATPEQANEVCKGIRQLLAELYDADTAAKAVIQYGGSMNAANAADLLAQYDIDGGLIGGASLKAKDFAAIVAAASA
ncbi:MAG: triose-phosphate isomerase [Oscillospiraceae bacterium]|jgi:triosephosphate isomerase|nr:triose-phosphate isomerase [Oscillospiraceae bacterium]